MFDRGVLIYDTHGGCALAWPCTRCQAHQTVVRLDAGIPSNGHIRLLVRYRCPVCCYEGCDEAELARPHQRRERRSA